MTTRRSVSPPPPGVTGGALPNLVIIGAMKCGTTALHRYLGMHPQIAMSRPKELNFFFGHAVAGRRPHGWAAGNWHRGVGWYAGHFPASAPVRGESSPGYTSPDHPEAAHRMAATIPRARLVYLVRDPIDRAVSQYCHHRRDGTERRTPEDALLDPASQYISRGRYHERLAPYLARFPGPRILVMASEDLRPDRRAGLRRVFGFVGVDPSFWCDAFDADPSGPGRPPPVLDGRVRDRLRAALQDDVDRFREVTGLALPRWST